MNLIVLRKKLADLLVVEERFLQKLIDEDRAPLEEEKKELDTFKSQRESFVDLIRRGEALEVEKGEFEKSTPSVSPHITITRGEGENDKGQYVPFKQFGEQLLAVRSASMNPHNVDPRLLEIQKRAAMGANEGVGAEGGFLVQTDFAGTLIRDAVETGVLASRCRKIPIGANANGVTMNVIDETSRASGSRWGGIQVYWLNEADEKIASKPKFAQLDMKLKKIAGLCYATDELLQDAVALGSIIKQAFNEEIGFEIDNAIMWGNGTGQPLGFMNSSSLVVVAKESAQGNGTLLGNNIIKMRSRLTPRSRQSAVWLINADVEVAFPAMSVGGAAGLNEFPIFQPATQLSEGYDRLYGLPIIAIEQTKSLGTLGDIVLADLSQYALLQKGGVETAESIHVRFVTDETVFRFVARVEGRPLWNFPMTPANGSVTHSPFVALAGRP